MNSRGNLSEFLAALIVLFLLTTLALPFYAKKRWEARNRRCASNSLRQLWMMNDMKSKPPATGSAFWKVLRTQIRSILWD